MTPASLSRCWRVSSKSSMESLYGTSTWRVNEVGVREMIVAFMVPVPRVRAGNQDYRTSSVTSILDRIQGPRLVLVDEVGGELGDAVGQLVADDVKEAGVAPESAGLVL